MDPRALLIYIDGSALTNPGQAVGCAGLVCYPDSDDEEDVELEWSYNYGTSGSMELSALVNAIKWINDNVNDIRERGINKVIIVSDNSIVVGGANTWVYSWYKNQWKRKDGSPVRNLSLWKDYIRERGKIKIPIEIKWKKGKSTNKTKIVDKLAKKAAKKPSLRKIAEKNLPSVGKSLTNDGSTATNYLGESNNVLIRVYYHQFIQTKGDSMHEIRFETIDNGKVTGKYRAYSSSEVDAELDRHHFYRAGFDTTSSFPKIASVVEVNEEELEIIKVSLVKNGYLKK